MNQTAAATTPPEVKVNETEANSSAGKPGSGTCHGRPGNRRKGSTGKTARGGKPSGQRGLRRHADLARCRETGQPPGHPLPSGLPQPSLERLSGGAYDTPEDLQKAIETERQYLAKLTESRVVDIGGMAPRSAQISAGRTSLEQLETAVEALLAGIRPADGVAPLSGIRGCTTSFPGTMK